ncbi:hypothetical protein GIY30_14160 [Gordonia sp. HNM0687]|uniref:Uncharacterized protein n=1 Tax=Gordonia mangrovi TaxID=2665643 RepID=A0A6L7GRF7_9ACTN|nr:hypothetical protein [Gordonia mangrovi]MXP22486.1 hypothetical protein [Gordonia mangrovi]UVF77639.1 hypothetical protein NWF22_20580 [Gordonia mangrovi]
MTGAVGGGNTNWFVAIQQILSRLESMGPESAAADAQALAQAITGANEAAQSLFRFGGDSLQGVAASSSEDAARQISSEIVSAAAKAQPGIDALVNAQSVLLASQAQRGPLMELQGELMNPLGDAFGAMTRAGLLMTETYNGPMSSAGDGLGPAGMVGGEGLLAGTGGGGSGGSSGTSAAARSSAAAATDMGDYGAPPATTPTTPPAGGTSAEPATSAGATAGGDTPLSLGEASSTGGGGGEGLDSLSRGGLGSPDSSSSTVSPAAMMMPGSAAAGAGGAKLAGGGAGGSSAGGSGGSSGANPSALSRRLSAALPGAVAPASGTPPTTPVGAGPSRAGAAPMGAPHGGGRGRGSNDTEHKSAHYLHTTDNGAEIVGTLPLVGPPVIGDWAPPQPVTPATPDAAEPARDADDNPDRDLKL